jgi:hypothetical protein
VLGLADFLDSLLRGALLVSLSLAFGSHNVSGLILVAMLIIAFILVLDREPNVVLSAD